MKPWSDPVFRRLLLMRTIGNTLLLLSLILFGKTFGPIVWQESVYAVRSRRNIPVTVAQSTTTPSPSPNGFSRIVHELQKKEEVIIPTDSSFSIVIPKIGANSKIIQNVDPSNYDSYITALKEGVAHARGTALPGDAGHMYLFAHSTDNLLNVSSYNAVFYLLYKLEPSDEILLFYKGKKHAYKVIDKKIVMPDEVEYLTRNATTPFLTLQTCWPPGTTLQRMLVFAVPVVQ